MGRNKKSKKWIKRIISIILSFLLTVIFTVVSIVLGIYVGFLNENRLLDGLNYKDYYSSVEKSFYENAKDVTIPIGLPEEVLDGIVESEKIHSDVKEYVVSSVNGQSFVIVTDDLRDKLEQNVRKYFEESGSIMSVEQENTIPEYTQLIADEYLNAVKVPVVSYFNQLKVLFQKMLLVLLPVCIVLTAIIIFILIRMQKWKHRGIRYIVYSTLSTCIMVALPGIVALSSGFYKKLNIASDYLYYALVKYISNGLWVFIYFAIIWMALSICMLFLIRFIKRYRN